MSSLSRIQHDKPTAKAVFFNLPPSLGPYLELARIDRPYGFVYFSVPFLSGLLHAGLLEIDSREHLPINTAKALLCSFLLRITACAWNDIIDAPIDRQVARTKTRPLARGAITVSGAVLMTAACFICFAAALNLMDHAAHAYAMVASVLWLIYPFLKRVTHLPQVFLSLVTAWNVLMGIAIVGPDPLVLDNILDAETASLAPSLTGVQLRSVAFHFLAYFAWQLLFDTVYGFQDIADDSRVGVKSTAILVQPYAKPFLMATGGLMILSLAAVGWYVQGGLAFFAMAVIGSGAICLSSVWSVDLRSPSSCFHCFSSGGLYTGIAILGGFVGELVHQTIA